MKATVKAMEVFPILAGLPYRVDGFVITVAARHYVVVDACSGLVLVSTATFLAYSLGLLLFRSLGRVLVLTLFSAVLAFLCNAARVNTIVIIDYLRGSQMELAAHTPIQWVALAALLAGLFYVVYRVAGDGARKRHAPLRATTSAARASWHR
jgi:exosortase/archaeosortase family protein